MISIKQVPAGETLGSWTYGTGGPAGRFGGANPNGRLHLHHWSTNVDGSQRLHTHRQRCSTYRKAQRKLRQWLNGYNV